METQLTSLDELITKITRSSRLNIMISVSRECVLQCNYCYAIDPENLPPKRVLSLDLVEKLIKDSFNTRHTHINFEWTGGEALLAGMDYYKKILELQKKYAPHNKTYHNCIQTSGGIYNIKFYDFLIENEFNISLTIDGPREIHEAQRPTKGLNSSFDTVIKSYHYIKSKQGRCGVLCTLTKNSVNKHKEILEFFRSLDVELFHTNPYVYDPSKPKQDQKLAVTPEEYASYYTNQYDTYLELDDRSITPNHIHYLMKQLSGIYKTRKCTNSGTCLTNFINIDDVGNAAICPKFLGYEEMRLGNISENTIDEILGLENPVMQRFVEQRLKSVNGCESDGCKYLSVCNSGCPYDSFLNSEKNDISERDYLCKGKGKIYKHIESSLQSFNVPTINSNNLK